LFLISLQVIDVKAQARGACDFIHRTYPLEATRNDVAFEILPKGDYFELYKNGHAFARLDKAFCSEARRLVGLGVRFQACMEQKRWEEVIRAWKSYTGETVTFSVDVNVKSLIHHADKVGDILLRSEIFLQSPSQNPGGETYYNPQILQIEGFCERIDEVMTEAIRSRPPIPKTMSNRSLIPFPTRIYCTRFVPILTASRAYSWGKSFRA
jgi:SWI/SNF-related matrix-associated actin-dependent regulator of chromatin subfamily A3